MSDLIYHYTDINALKSILTNEKLWMTSHEFLNDTEEFQDGFNRLQISLNKTLQNPQLTETTRQALNDMLKLLTNTIVLSTSFSKNGDLLSQWRSYTPIEGGFAIGFDRTLLNIQYQDDESYINFFDCIYDKDEKQRLSELFGETTLLELNRLKKFDNNLRTSFDHMMYHLLLFIISSKNNNFSEEKEIRLATYIHKDLVEIDIENMSHSNASTVQYENGRKLYSKKELLFRSKSNLLIPYIEQVIDLKSIKEIIVGPTTNKDTVIKSLEFFIKSLDLNIEIKSSNIPYRTF